ncbi:hypothetical protein BMS3Abin14_00099 [bacterium BMS3Abin14]|nr:hypothetical protein BMS3Abin14_00099 [bacterium BMS3Abin14]
MMPINGLRPNFNHRRQNAPVRCCPMWGEVANSKIPQRVCREEKHAKSGRERSAYCMDCGEQLIQGK